MNINYKTIVMFEADLQPLEQFPFEDAYKTFGLKPGASRTEVKNAVKRLSKKYHPDRVIQTGTDPREAAEKMRDISIYKGLLLDKDNEAYRKAFEKGGKSAVEALKKAEAQGVSPDFPQAADPFSYGFAADVFSDPFSYAGRALYRRKGDLFQFDPNSTKNEGRWRLKDPKFFHKIFRIKSKTSGVSYIMGRNKRTKKVEVQAIRFNKKIMSERKAAQWWRKNKHRFRKEWAWPRR